MPRSLRDIHEGDELLPAQAETMGPVQARDGSGGGGVLVDPQRLRARLLRRRFPGLGLPPFWHGLPAQHEVSRYVIYTFHCVGSHSGGEETEELDAAQHCAFRDLREEWSAHRIRVLGLSSQRHVEIAGNAIALGVQHELVADPNLLVAEALELPTWAVDGERYYQRLVLIIDAATDESGRIAHVFYPVAAPERAACQALTWVKLNGFCGHDDTGYAS